MEFTYLRDLALIIIFAKVCGLLAAKLKAPQVVGEIIAGLIIGPSILGLVHETDFILQTAEVGVILLMFSAGLETNLKDLIRTGPMALAIACVGVFIPLAGGTLLYSAFFGFDAIGSDGFFEAIFIGVVMTATSVSITVQTLRELNKLKGRIGTLILSAAIIDDIIGIIVLTFVIGMRTPNSNPSDVVISTVLFFVFAFGVGFLTFYVFKKINEKHAHHRRLPILGLALCIGLAYVAESVFGIADITGAYVAGIILCSLRDSSYIAEKMDVSSYMIFGPVFFVSIGLKTEFDNFTMELLIFSLAFVAVALLTKVVGCGLLAKIMKFNTVDSLKIGVGMMTRGEVALIVAQKGLAAGLLAPQYFTPIILLIIVSSIATPILLKLLYRKDSETHAELPERFR